MKIMNIILMLSLAVILSNCSMTKLQYDSDPGVNFLAIKSYDWLEKGEEYPENAKDALTQGSLWDKRIKKAVNIELLSLGLQMKSEEPDVLVTYYTSVEDKEYSLPGSFRGARGRYWGWGSDFETSKYKEGTVIIDVLDAKSKDILWRGIAVTRVNNDFKPRDVEKDLSRAVRKMFAKLRDKLEA